MSEEHRRMLETCSEFLQQFLSVFFCPLSLYTLHCIFFSCSLAFFSIGQRCFLRNIFLRQSHHTQRSKKETEKTNTKTPFARGTACCSTKHSRFFDSVGMDEPRTILILLRFKSAQRDGEKVTLGETSREWTNILGYSGPRDDSLWYKF